MHTPLNTLIGLNIFLKILFLYSTLMCVYRPFLQNSHPAKYSDRSKYILRILFLYSTLDHVYSHLANYSDTDRTKYIS